LFRRSRSAFRSKGIEKIGAGRPIHLVWMERYDGELGRGVPVALTHAASAPIPPKTLLMRRFATRAIFAALNLPLHPLKADGGVWRLAVGELANHLSLDPRKADGGGDAPTVGNARRAAPTPVARVRRDRSAESRLKRRRRWLGLNGIVELRHSAFGSDAQARREIACYVTNAQQIRRVVIGRMMTLGGVCRLIGWPLGPACDSRELSSQGVALVWETCRAFGPPGFRVALPDAAVRPGCRRGRGGATFQDAIGPPRSTIYWRWRTRLAAFLPMAIARRRDTSHSER
jgi:hypothetical protein